MKSIIDGQQRLTSLTLFLIFLNNLQKELGGKESIEPLVFSEKYGQKSFNIQVEERKTCLEKLFLEGTMKFSPTTTNQPSTWRSVTPTSGKPFPRRSRARPFPTFSIG